MKRLIVAALIVLILGVSTSLFLSARDTEYGGFAYGGDDHAYGHFGKLLAEYWKHNKVSDELDSDLYSYGLGLQSFFYYHFCGAVYYVFGKHGTIVLLILNSLFHILILYPIYQICKELDIKSEKVMFMALLWPSLFYWSLFNLKEAFVLFFLFMVIHFAMKVKRRKDFINTAGLLISLLVIDQTRFSFSTIAIIVLAYLTFEWRWNKFIILLLVVGCFLIRIKSTTYLWHLPSSFTGVKTVEPIKLKETAYLQYKPLTGWSELSKYTPYGFFATIFYPFILTKAKYVLATVENMVWVCFLPFIIRSFLNKKALLLTMIFIYWFVLLVYTQGNMGTLYRLKSVLYYLTFILMWRIGEAKCSNS